MSWKKYPVNDFNEYIIFRVVGYNTKIEISRTKSLEFTDSSYAGEGVRYELEVIKKNGQLFPWGFLELQSELPRLSFHASEDNEYIIKWSKSRYYNAVDTFKLAISKFSDWNFIIAKATRNPEDTTYTITSSLFGDNLDFKLRLVPKNNILYSSQDYNRFESTLYDVELGFPFKSGPVSANHITQVNNDEFAYILNCDSLIRYSVSQKRKVERLTYEPSYCSMCRFTDFEASVSGKYMTAYVDCDFKLMLINSDNLSNNIIHDLKSFSGQNYAPLIPVSDLATGIVNNSGGGFYIYDFKSSSSLGYYKKDIYGGFGSSISSDGSYIFLTDDSLRLVHFENSQFTSVWRHSMFSTPKYYAFDGTNPGRLVIWDGSVFSVRNCSDFSELYSFPLTDGYLMNIDYYSGEMLTYSDGHLYVRNFADGTLIKDIPVNIDPTNWYYTCILINHAVICTAGVIYFIK
jgi:predicted Zn-ribbon and HTH transcriptional regulator